VEVKLSVLGRRATVIDWLCSEAAAYVLVAEESASIVHVPTALRVTSPVLIEHTAEEPLSMVNDTEEPEVAVAVGV
jgi:hypothetical protein